MHDGLDLGARESRVRSFLFEGLIARQLIFIPFDLVLLYMKLKRR
jgi:hypothetical protein